MKRWAALTVLLYLMLLFALTVPGLLFYGLEYFHQSQPIIDQTLSLSAALEVYQSWAYWTWLGVMALAQAALLFVPLRVTQRRYQPTRHLFVPVVTTGFLLANLLLAGV